MNGKIPPIDWIKEAAEPARTYRKMVVGWQNSVTALHSTVLSFNNEYLKQQEAKDRDTHHSMREIAVKKLVISSLFELKPQLDEWYRQLKERGVLSDKSKNKKQEVRNIIKQIRKYEGIRNAAFHYGDVNEDTDELVHLYEEIQKIEMAFLNRILVELVKLGYMLRADALTRT